MALGNKDVFKKNLRKYMELTGKTRKEMCDALGFSYTTFADWYNGTKYPRIDKIEQMARYFGILKSDLIEDKPEKDPERELATFYMDDAKIRQFVLFAGGLPAGENRDKMLDALMQALAAMAAASKGGKV